MIFDALRDAFDILKQARHPVEVARAIVPGLAPPIVLNEGELPTEAADPAALLRALRNARHELKSHLAEGKVDYASLREQTAFRELERLAPGLRALTPAHLEGDHARIAFFINLYNVLAIHGVLALDIHRSVMEVPSFFSRVSYRVGDACISLDGMENGVLRVNAGHPATGKPVLRSGDPALAFAPARADPRIHAALVCASTSCPPVGFYDAERLDAQLDLAARNYVNADVKVEGELVRLPVTFRYYAVDWGGRAGIEAWLVRYADAPLAAELQAAFARGARLEYPRYDWSLNFV